MNLGVGMKLIYQKLNQMILIIISFYFAGGVLEGTVSRLKKNDKPKT